MKQYAEAVGLNSEELFEEFKKDIPDSYNDEVSDKLSSIKPQRELPAPASKALELLPTLLVSAGVIVVIAIIYVIVQAVMGGGNENSAEQTKTEETESKYDVSKDSPLKNENQKNADNEKSGAEDKKDDDAQKTADKKELSIKAVNSQGSSTTYEVSGADKLELEVTTTADSWVRVRDAKGTSLKEGMMKKGDSFQKNITDQDQIELRVGYAPGVEIKINGKVLSYELDPKNVMTQNITIENKKEKKSS
ncbi:membrane protein [Bacillus glycinifermentans]|nr:membrane protein [Bacillus glycinifermentans]